MKRSKGAAHRPVPAGPLQLVTLARQLADPELVQLVEEGAAWSRAAQDQWGAAGFWLPDEWGRCQGLALVCPALHLPPGHPLDGFVRHREAAQLLALASASAPDQTARTLVQALCRHLVGQVALIDVAGASVAPSSLQPPVPQLLASGFQLVDELPLDGRQRLRLELRRTVRWDLPGAWRRVCDLAPRPYRPPEPTGRDAGALRSERETATVGQ